MLEHTNKNNKKNNINYEAPQTYDDTFSPNKNSLHKRLTIFRSMVACVQNDIPKINSA